jgi:hypothetical protein
MMGSLPSQQFFQSFFCILSQTFFCGVQLAIFTFSKKCNKMTITEVVLYQIKADALENYSEATKVADDFLVTRSGFLSRIVKQDHSDPTIFMDIVEWQCLEDALNASEAFKNEASLMPFFQVFEKVISFNHLHTFA